jgi:stage III sporulation protein AE
MIKKNIANSEITSVLDMISSAITVLCVIKIVEQPLRQSISVLENIRMFVNTASPLICSMYAMGGNVKAAIVNNYGLLVFLSIFENVCIIGIEIILGVCTSLAVASAFLQDGNLSALSNAIKKCFTFILGFAMLIFTTVISTQNILSAKADSLSSKTAKMLASQMIPLVGSTVGESLKSAGASIEYLRANVGILLIIILVLMIAPTVISLFLYRFTLTFSNAIAGLLSCDKEGKILTEISSILGYALAILIICAIALVYLLTIFAKCSSALN